MVLGLLGAIDLAVVALVISFATFLVLRSNRSVHAKVGNIELTVDGMVPTIQEVAAAVNNVHPDEPKLIDQIRIIGSRVDGMDHAVHANHIATVSCETAIHGFSERLIHIGMKADAAHNEAADAASQVSEAHATMQEFIAEQTALRNAAANGLIERRRLSP